MAKRIRNILLEIGNALIVNGFRARQYHLFDFLPRCFFNRRQHASFTRRYKQDGVATSPRPSRPGPMR